jgi:hypothetical protein
MKILAANNAWILMQLGTVVGKEFVPASRAS